jgi:hypothetical protein
MPRFVILRVFEDKKQPVAFLEEEILRLSFSISFFFPFNLKVSL